MYGRHKWRRSLTDSLARLSLELLSVFLFLQFIFPFRSVAQVIVRGVVRNGTTGQLQAGDDVSLLLGSNDIGHLRSGKDGQFEFVNPLTQHAPKEALSVRAIHGGIAYQQTIRFGGNVVLTVFDTSKAPTPISELVCILQFMTIATNVLEVAELHAMRNETWPPRTDSGPEISNFHLPKGAQIKSFTLSGDHEPFRDLLGTSGGGRPSKSAFPLKPGLTEVVLTYDVPYEGTFTLERRVPYSVGKLLVVLPPSMMFKSSGKGFRPIPDNSDAKVEEFDSVAKGRDIEFKISGTGNLKSVATIKADPNPIATPATSTPVSTGTPIANASTPLIHTMIRFFQLWWRSILIGFCLFCLCWLGIAYRKRTPDLRKR